MKLWMRTAIFLSGLAILFFSWHRVHNQAVTLPAPNSGSNPGSAEIFVVIGGFVMLMAFAPSQEALGRWMSLKKPKKARAAHFKRRH